MSSPLRFMPAALLSMALLAGCDKKPQAAPVASKDEGRANTKVIEAASLVGYDGKALRKKTDGVLDANDQRNADVQKALDDSQ